MKHLVLSLSALLLFTACSNKKYFEPSDVEKDIEVKETVLSSKIKSFNRFGATLEDNHYVSLNGESKEKLPKGFTFLNLSNTGEVLASNSKDKILVGEKEIPVKNPVVAASLKDNKLAVLYSNNTIELIDIETNRTLFKEYNSLSLANDTRVANPHFMGNLVLFPTLNGKVIIVSTKTNESVKNIAVDPQGQFNNIIYLGVMQEQQTLITATANKIVSISPKQILAKDYEIRDVLVKDTNVYIATIDGRIIKLTPNLNEVASKKYKFSKVYALAYTDSLYAIESQGFVVNLNEDFSKDKIYNFDFDNEERLFVLGNKIYSEDKVFQLP